MRKNLKKTLLILISFFLPISFFLAGCGNNQQSQKDDNKIKVYTTVYPLDYFTQRIGGSFTEVNSIYPPGADEHTFDPTQKDIMKLVEGDLFLYIGLGLEGFVNKAQETLKNENVTMVAAAENLSLEDGANGEVHKDEGAEVHEDEGAEVHEDEGAEIHEDEGADEHEHEHESHSSIDPHVWLDPIYSQDIAETIKDALVEQMPEQKDTFEKNYEELKKELQELHQSFEDTVQTAKRKEIITAHAAYGYWEQRYGLEQISISGFSTTNEPSQKKLEEIIKLAEQKNIKYIIFEQNVSSKLTEIVKQEIGAKTLTLHNLSVLTEDDIKNNETYFTLMKSNLETLSKALND